MDQITIADLEAWSRVGVSEEERANPQRLLLTIIMDHDVSAAARSDELSATIDYFTVSQNILKLAGGNQWRLIESLAVDIANYVLREYAAARVAVEVKKFVLPETRYVSVRVERMPESRR